MGTEITPGQTSDYLGFDLVMAENLPTPSVLLADGPHKTLYSRWKRWSERGIFARMLVELADQSGETDTLMIDATYLKTHRTASSLGLKKGGVAA